MLRRPSFLLRALAAGSLAGAGLLAGCGVDDGGPCGVERVDVAMQPRVVLDGTIELSDRTAGRVIIDEVIAHAPHASLQGIGLQTLGVVNDVVVDASDPLLFRYALADRTGFGAALPSLAASDGATERVWSVPAVGAAVNVAFGSADDDIADAYDDNSAVLDGLGGHTLIVHGTIAVETDVRAYGTLSDVDPDGSVAKGGDPAADVDPDGTPATDPEHDVDPDGGAAAPDPADVDPDGGAAKGDIVADVDPDGGAAKGALSDVDPDGTPAVGGADSTRGDAVRPHKTAKAKATATGYGRRAVVNVPFSLVADGDFRRQVVLEAEDIASVGVDDILPLDLHLSAAELLDADRIDELEAVAISALAKDDDAVIVMPVSRNTTVRASTVNTPGSIKKPPTVVEGSSRIRVSGDLRR